MNKDTIAGALKNAAGHVKQTTGEAIGNEKLANSGAADRVKGATQEAWGRTKDAAHDLGNTHETTAKANAHETAHNVRESIAEAAERTKDSISRGVEISRPIFTATAKPRTPAKHPLEIEEARTKRLFYCVLPDGPPARGAVTS